MMGFVIVHNQDGLPQYFTLTAKAGTYVRGSWADALPSALGFARRSDAESYLATHLPHMQHVATITEKELAA
jgi:hypothetical protein